MKIQILRQVTAVLLGVFVFAAATASAADNACSQDIHKVCKDVPFGGGRIVKCLKDHESQISAPCRTFLGQVTAKHEKMKTQFSAFKQACADDKKKLCDGDQGGKGQVLKCLQDHRVQLKPTCREQMDKAIALKNN